MLIASVLTEHTELHRAALSTIHVQIVLLPRVVSCDLSTSLPTHQSWCWSVLAAKVQVPDLQCCLMKAGGVIAECPCRAAWFAGSRAANFQSGATSA